MVPKSREKNLNVDEDNVELNSLYTIFQIHDELMFIELAMRMFENSLLA